MSERPVSRQPSCGLCSHEWHTFTRCHSEIGDTGALCPCPPRMPTGLYP
jgi:hypothetical protein